MEGTGEKFSVTKQQRAQELTKSCVDEFSRRVHEGITEKEGHALLEEICRSKGAEGFWHPHKFRMGPDSLKSFREKGNPELRLNIGDLYFVDIGPIFDSHEGDYGQSFVFQGDDPDKLFSCQLAKDIFKQCEKAWREDGLTGKGLYQLAAKLAADNHHQLNLNMSGHRIGDFPHAVYFKGKLIDTDCPLSGGLWVLEILLKHDNGRWGSFFEDIIQSSR